MSSLFSTLLEPFLNSEVLQNLSILPNNWKKIDLNSQRDLIESYVLVQTTPAKLGKRYSSAHARALKLCYQNVRPGSTKAYWPSLLLSLNLKQLTLNPKGESNYQFKNSLLDVFNLT